MRSMRISQEKGSTTNNVKTLYDIEVTKDDKENKRVKINYVDTASHMTNGENTTETKTTSPSLGTKRNLPTNNH